MQDMGHRQEGGVELTSIGRDFPAIFFVRLLTVFISLSASARVAPGWSSATSSTRDAAVELGHQYLTVRLPWITQWGDNNMWKYRLRRLTKCTRPDSNSTLPSVY